MTVFAGAPQVDCRAWLRRWDAQQQGYVPEREQRFTAMFDALAGLPDSFVAVDLGCGPGSLSERLLGRFPHASVVAVDVDPVLLAIGSGALGTMDGRLRWVDADLASAGWTDGLAATRVDAVLSTTALHWLTLETLTRMYQDLGRLLRPGGLFLNGDHMRFGQSLPTFARLSERALGDLWTDASFEQRGIETAEQWWDAVGREPAFANLLAERSRRFSRRRRPDPPAGYDDHVEALSDAGFREVGTIWQVLSDRVLLAVR